MDPYNDLRNYPELPRLLGTKLYNELFVDNPDSQPDSNDLRVHKQSSHNLQNPPSTASAINPSSYHHISQPSHMKAYANPQNLQDLARLQYGKLPEDFQSFQAMTCPLNTDDSAKPEFKCDCGEMFNELDSLIAHRETNEQHKPWHGVWEAQGKDVCLCGRSFDDELAVHRHIKLAYASIRRQRWENGERRIKMQQQLRQLQTAPVRPKQKQRPTSVVKSRGQEEATKLQQHVESVDKRIVEGTMKQLFQDKEDKDKAEWQAYRKISQKQRKQLEKDKLEAKKLADQAQDEE